ncbi:hypothetical protein SCP_1301670 [Sparassis crispa]|uniref:Zn(2)-C6 fungal-type domain-containing protein n=1 Tax=Sparassis crispa TaxID=139825 RepID=A0A401H1S8_9APHY|nr:hypothetical protein SCP_1301670 [Sparassis crispa]GBE88352.1 hypothetical protein SCP_1301670 [Sparassis crispa]
MNPSQWSHGQLPPPQSHQLQLEQEYDIDPAQFQVLQTDGMQRYERRQAQAQNMAYPTYAQSYPPENSQHAYGYTDPSLNVQQSQNLDALYGANVQYPASSETQTTYQQQYQPTSNAYLSPYSNAVHTYTSSYDSHAPQSTDVHIGQSQSNSRDHLAPISTFQTVRRTSSQQSLYVSPSSTLSMTPYSSHSSSAEPSIDMQAGGLFKDDPSYHPQIPPPTLEQALGAHAMKRARGLIDDFHDSDDAGVEAEGQVEGPHTKADVKPKLPGACKRCKGLKVRCEFITDPDTCKRCKNGGHECVIPGRKKRKPPPKREYLLNQIRDQAEQIKVLIQQLDEANRMVAKRRSLANSGSPLQSTDRTSSLSISPGELTSPDIVTPKEEDEVAPQEVQDWISKARESIEAFGGFINMGGPSVTREMLGDEGSDGSEDSSAEFDVSADGADAEETAFDVGADGEGETFQSFPIPEGMEGHIVGNESFTSDDNGGVAGRGRGRLRNNFSRESTESAPDTTHSGKRGGGATKLAILPSESVPFGLMANLALRKKGKRRSSRDRDAVGAEDSQTEVGLANDNYFRPSAAPERPIIQEAHQPPHILRNGLVSPAEVERLFAIYFDYMNLSVSLLDPVLYTAQKTYWRSPFLFTVICAIASRHYNMRPELYQQAMKYARLAAGTALIGGQKSVEVVEAYILLALYPVPVRRWEEDRCWLYLGLAIRVATDLNLHHPNTPSPDNEMHAREMLNRTRVWLNCFNLDRSTSSQYGKSSIISNSDYTANHSEYWWKCSPFNMDGFDIQLCCYNAELKVMADFRSRIYSDPTHPTGLNKKLDFTKIASDFDDHLSRLWETWIARVRECQTDDPQCHFRTGLLKLAYSYARLTVLAVGFQHGKVTSSNEVPFLWRCLRAATDVVNAVVDDIGIPSQKVYLRHGPEAQSVFVTFASAFLVKLLQPKYTAFITREQRIEIRDHVQRVIDLLGSPEVGIDDRHGPKLYSLFLKGLLATPMARIDHSPGSINRDTFAARRVAQKYQKNQLSSSSSSQSDFGQSASPPPSSGSSLNTNSPQQNPLSVGPYGPQTQPGPTVFQSQYPTISQMSTPEFLAPPLPFDHEMIQSMQSLTDPNIWPDIALPGFNWMGMQTDSGVQGVNVVV